MSGRVSDLNGEKKRVIAYGDEHLYEGSTPGFCSQLVCENLSGLVRFCGRHSNDPIHKHLNDKEDTLPYGY